jgi:serine protease Do
MVGTGLIVDERGYVITNRHVVGAETHVKVRLLDRTDLTGRVIYTDPSTDLAIIQVTTKTRLPAQSLAPASDLLEGEDVIAVGHPFGYSYTVSKGIVSALNREIRMPNGYVLTGLIQTDAAINPGNSGGPLININGEVIGINVALREGAQSIAFAINADTVKRVLLDRLSALQVSGVNHGLKVQERVVAPSGPRQQLVLSGVDSKVASAGSVLKQGDQILCVGDRTVCNQFDLERAFWDSKPGVPVTLKVLRQGREITVQWTVQGNGSSQVAAAASRKNAR